MSWFTDYTPMGAIYGAFTGEGGGDEYSAAEHDEMTDTSWACAACDAPISSGDSNCPSCLEIVEWDQPPIT